jgi:hypothetical protein
LAEIALAARPAGCELLSLEGVVLPGAGRRPVLRLIEANLRPAGASQVALAAQTVAATAGVALRGYWAGNVAVASGESTATLLAGLRCRAEAAGHRVTVLGRETSDTAKILLYSATADTADLVRWVHAHV